MVGVRATSGTAPSRTREPQEIAIVPRPMPRCARPRQPSNACATLSSMWPKVVSTLSLLTRMIRRPKADVLLELLAGE